MFIYEKMAKDKERILIFVAHADDEIIGCGGTIAKYVKEGKEVLVVVFSAGEKSAPWLKEEVITKQRKKESMLVAKYIGGRVEFLGLPDLKLDEAINDEVIEKLVIKIKKTNPEKIFTHSSFDAHPDHLAVNKAVKIAVEKSKLRKKLQLLTFSVYLANPRDTAKIYVDITNTFKDKIKALRAFKSQAVIVSIFLIPTYIKAITNGIKSGCKYAEVFYLE